MQWAVIEYGYIFFFLSDVCWVICVLRITIWNINKHPLIALCAYAHALTACWVIHVCSFVSVWVVLVHVFFSCVCSVFWPIQIDVYEWFVFFSLLFRTVLFTIVNFRNIISEWLGNVALCVIAAAAARLCFFFLSSYYFHQVHPRDTRRVLLIIFIYSVHLTRHDFTIMFWNMALVQSFVKRIERRKKNTDIYTDRSFRMQNEFKF